MDKIDTIYDHYKETFQISRDMQQKRGKLFVALCLFELLNVVVLIFPNEFVKVVSEMINSQYQTTVSLNIAILQSAVWITITYLMVRYYQTNIYVERQYKYIALLEEKISTEINDDCFNRESTNYLTKYPKVLDLISTFYTWIIPVLIIVANTIKIIFEWIYRINIWGTLFDTFCFVFCVVLSCLYLALMHPKKKN